MRRRALTACRAELQCYNAPLKMEPLFQITASDGAGAGQRVVRVTGRLGHDSVPQFLKAARTETSPTLILDLSTVPGVDSAGVGALLQIYRARQKAGKRLCLAGTAEHVITVLHMCRLNHLFEMFASVAEAETKLG